MDISDLLTQARDGKNEIRQLGEAKIDECATQDFGQFILSCSREIADDNKNPENRMLASTLIKNMLNNNGKFVGKWEMLGMDIKSDVKSGVLSTLASSNFIVRKAAALCVAGIYKKEYSASQWPELIDILVQTSSSDNQNFQAASIMTLGYISQEIQVNEFQVSDVDKILSAFIIILQKSQINAEVAKTTMIAFNNYICFAKKNFEKEVSLIFILFFRKKEKLFSMPFSII